LSLPDQTDTDWYTRHGNRPPPTHHQRQQRVQLGLKRRDAARLEKGKDFVKLLPQHRDQLGVEAQRVQLRRPQHAQRPGGRRGAAQGAAWRGGDGRVRVMGSLCRWSHTAGMRPTGHAHTVRRRSKLQRCGCGAHLRSRSCSGRDCRYSICHASAVVSLAALLAAAEAAGAVAGASAACARAPLSLLALAVPPTPLAAWGTTMASSACCSCTIAMVVVYLCIQRCTSFREQRGRSFLCSARAGPGSISQRWQNDRFERMQKQFDSLGRRFVPRRAGVVPAHPPIRRGVLCCLLAPVGRRRGPLAVRHCAVQRPPGSAALEKERLNQARDKGGESKACTAWRVGK
jgi:hypothetical protein